MTNGKKDILIIMGRYLPGYKDGGPVRSIQNLVDYLGEEYNFKVLTCDRDHGDIDPYPNIKYGVWNKVGNASVYYVPPKGFSFSIIKKLASQVDLVYCCGCFNDYAIKSLILNRFGLLRTTMVVAAMGLFSPGEFKLKYKKKKIFTSIFNILGLFKNISWSATSEMEISEIKQQIKTCDNFFIAEDLPRRIESLPIKKEKNKGQLRIVWISRIAPKKNLLGAIRILNHVKSNIEFYIYGPKHVEDYWAECEAELIKLPENIKWSWEGPIESDVVVETLKQYHLFLFPTLGENYGHVIQEALSAGCAIILSDQTPWKDLELYGVGYVHSLDSLNKFVENIESYAIMNEDEFQEIIANTSYYSAENNKKSVENTGYRNLFDAVK